ncbi:MAG: HAMP domain-containing sensor histidine kinase [Pseudomonadota bacterium]
MQQRRDEPVVATASAADGVSQASSPDHEAATALAPRRSGWRTRLPRPSSLPAKLLLLTIAFVMLAEILIFAPSISYYRLNWLNDRLSAAYIASLATNAAPDGQMPAALRAELLASADVKAIAVKTDLRRRMILPADQPIVIDASFDIMPESKTSIWQRPALKLSQIRDAFYVFFAPADRMIRAYGRPAAAPESGPLVEVVLAERVLRDAMLSHARNIFWLSVIISIIAAALVYVALSRLLVRPMMRIASNMVAFAEQPEDRRRIIKPSGRTDEVGTAEHQLAAMQSQLAQAFAERNRLAQLGLAVSKINHDLRNMLSSAQMMSDRLSMVEDETTQRFAPKLIASLDRAIDFCNATLKFGRAAEAPPNRARCDVAQLVDEVADGLGLPSDAVGFRTEIDPGTWVDGDREHLYRVLNNICRNAAETLTAGATPDAAIVVVARRSTGNAKQGQPAATRIIVSDNGPGVPQKARENLFRAFQGNARVGGTGLGLAISYELVAAHGGHIALLDTPIGASFEIVVPDALAEK